MGSRKIAACCPPSIGDSSGMATRALSPAARDAFAIFEVLCLSGNGKRPQFLQLESLQKTSTFDLSESVLTNNHRGDKADNERMCSTAPAQANDAAYTHTTHKQNDAASQTTADDTVHTHTGRRRRVACTRCLSRVPALNCTHTGKQRARARTTHRHTVTQAEQRVDATTHHHLRPTHSHADDAGHAHRQATRAKRLRFLCLHRKHA
jgi:hypothetical protein